VIVPAWAAGFSAFGCACAEYEYRYDKSVDIGVGPKATDAEKVQACKTLTEAWAELSEKVIEEFIINGFKPEDVLLRPGYRMQFMGQLNDLEINSPITNATTLADWEKMVHAFDETYARVYAKNQNVDWVQH
jgi:acetone carboxylase beta subunit